MHDNILNSRQQQKMRGLRVLQRLQDNARKTPIQPTPAGHRLLASLCIFCLFVRPSEIIHLKKIYVYEYVQGVH